MRVLLFVLCLMNWKLHAQNPSPNSKPPTFNFSNGVGFVSPDSSFSMNIRVRMQNRIGGTLTEIADGNWQVTQNEFRVRRARVRFDGFIFNPKWMYTLQLSFSRADIDWDNTNVPNILRDAMVFYKPNSHFTIGFGQGKLPGNRQQIISSGELQFADRSIVNTNFSIERDMGLQFYYTFKTGKPTWNLRAALTSGDGKNEGVESYTKYNPGLSYSGRFEFLPLGDFTNKGDNFESDVMREPKPKLSIAGGMCYNELAVKTGGQLGRALYNPISINSIYSDALFKFKGFSTYAEYMQKSTIGSPLSNSYNSTGTILDTRYVYTGYGYLIQSGYVFKNLIEVAGRYAEVVPQGDIRSKEKIKKNYTICVTKFIRGNRMKLQSDLTFEELFDGLNKQQSGRNLQFRFQIEMGI